MIEVPINKEWLKEHDKREATASVYYRKCEILALRYEEEHPEDTAMRGFANSLNAIRHIVFRALGTMYDWKNSVYNQRSKEGDIVVLKQRDIDITIDFVRWYDAEYPDNQMSTVELRDIIEPHLHEYWNPENQIDDCNQFFREVMDRNEESC